ncbi:hypothetical protein AB0C59_30105 [Streptomyces sp. NPDC048664]|uniref:Rv1733c family protein n=1 Tax=Streptomyces sp. NPDC048664 TaxID=3154505 RepID=UPI0034297C23
MAIRRRATGARVWLWRWRRNPLLRRSDRLEAWIVLATWVFVALAGVIAGRTAATAVAQELTARRVATPEVRAVLTESTPGAPHATPDYSDGAVWARASWEAAGSTHTGLVRTGPGLSAGTSVTVWTDPSGALATRPATPHQIGMQSLLVGSLVGLGAGGGMLLCGLVARGRLEARCLQAWDREWESVGPRWRRTIG